MIISPGYKAIFKIFKNSEFIDFFQHAGIYMDVLVQARVYEYVNKNDWFQLGVNVIKI